MAIAVVFWTFLLAACLLVVWYGQATERGFLAFLVACSALTLVISPELGLVSSRYALLGVDAIILFVALAVVSYTKSYWPIWLAGFHSIAVATDAARLMFPRGVTSHYLLAEGFWSIPVLLVLVLGTLADHRMRTAARTSA